MSGNSKPRLIGISDFSLLDLFQNSHINFLSQTKESLPTIMHLVTTKNIPDCSLLREIRTNSCRILEISRISITVKAKPP